MMPLKLVLEHNNISSTVSDIRSYCHNTSDCVIRLKTDVAESYRLETIMFYHKIFKT